MMKKINQNDRTKHGKSRAQPENRFLASLNITIKKYTEYHKQNSTSIKNKLYQILKSPADEPSTQ